MTSHYRNIISIACLFLCLYVASAHSSLIQQVTDGFTTSPQRMQSSEDKGRPPPKEVFDVNNKASYINNSGTFNWTVRRFTWYLASKYTELTSDAFQTIGGTKWNLRVLPKGQHASKTQGLSIYLVLDKNQILEPSQKFSVIANLRVLNQQESKTVQRRLNGTYRAAGAAGGFDDVVPLADLRNPSKGFLVNDELRVQVEFVTIS